MQSSLTGSLAPLSHSPAPVGSRQKSIDRSSGRRVKERKGKRQKAVHLCCIPKDTPPAACLACLFLSYSTKTAGSLGLGLAETRASPLKARSVQREGRPPSHYCAVQRCNTVLVLELAPYILSPSPSLSLALLTHSSFYLVDNLTHHTKRRDRICSIQSCPALPPIQQPSHRQSTDDWLCDWPHLAWPGASCGLEKQDFCTPPDNPCPGRSCQPRQLAIQSASHP